MFDRAPSQPGKREPVIQSVSYPRGPLLFSRTPADPVRGELLRAQRECAGLSLKDAADAIGCTPVGLSSVERGWENLPDEEWRRVSWLIRPAQKGGVR